MKLYYYRLTGQKKVHSFLAQDDDDARDHFNGHQSTWRKDGLHYVSCYYVSCYEEKDDEGYGGTVDLIFTFDPNYRVLWEQCQKWEGEIW